MRMTCRAGGGPAGGVSGMRSNATVAVRSLRSPSFTARCLFVLNVIVTAPPSPRQMHVAGLRSSLSQKMFGYRTTVGN